MKIIWKKLASMFIFILSFASGVSHFLKANRSYAIESLFGCAFRFQLTWRFFRISALIFTSIAANSASNSSLVLRFRFVNPKYLFKSNVMFREFRNHWINTSNFSRLNLTVCHKFLVWAGLGFSASGSLLYSSVFLQRSRSILLNAVRMITTKIINYIKSFCFSDFSAVNFVKAWVLVWIFFRSLTYVDMTITCSEK